jgi:hypothetical protein
MTTEEKVEYLEDKLARTIQLIKFIVRMDSGLSKDNTDWLLEQIDIIQQWEN